MSCPLLRERLTLYAEGILDQGERRQVEAHLETCDECRTTLEEILATRDLLRQIPPVVFSSDVVEETAERIRRARSGVRRRKRASARPLLTRLPAAFRQPAVVGALAVAVLLAALLWGLGEFHRRPVPPVPPQAQAEQDMDFYLQEHALAAEQSMLTADEFSWLVVTGEGSGQK